MKVVVLGLWHLGCVTAVCCAEHFEVTGLDFDAALTADLKRGVPPIAEPGLEELMKDRMAAGALTFTSDAEAACATADVLWVCDDTPVDDEDRADTEFVFAGIRRCLPHLAPKAKHRVEVYNLGTPKYCRVTDSIGWICAHLGVEPKLEFTDGEWGWIGDNPFIFLETAKAQATGWKPRLNIQQGIVKTLAWVQHNQWVLDRR